MATTRPTRAGRPFAIAGRLVDLVLLAVIATGLTAVVLGRVLPALGHPVYVVAGPSMAPALAVGSAVVLDVIDPADLRVGDVVSLSSGPERAVFTHRVIRIADRPDGRWVETQGDANPQPDPSITPAGQIVGRVGVSIPYAGYLLALLSTIQGVVLLVSTGLALMLLGWWLDDVAAERRRWAIRLATPAGAPAAVTVVTSADDEDVPAVATGPVTPAPVATGTISAVDLARSDPGGRRRRRRSTDLARSRS